MKLICKNFGLTTNTEVESCYGRVLITNGLDITSLVNLWRWYYSVSFWEKIELEVSKELYNSIQSKPTIEFCKSVEGLLYDNGVTLRVKEE